MTDRETMIHVYEAEIEVLQNENNQLKAQDDILDSGKEEEYNNEDKVPKKSFAEFNF